MNVELIRRIADAIEKHPELYDQADWGNNDLDLEPEFGDECGTPCCIGGWARHLLGIKMTKNVYDALGLSANSEWGILEADWSSRWLERADLEHRVDRWPPDMFDPTAIEAATILRAMADEGKWWERYA